MNKYVFSYVLVKVLSSDMIYSSSARPFRVFPHALLLLPSSKQTQISNPRPGRPTHFCSDIKLYVLVKHFLPKVNLLSVRPN